MDLTEKLFGKPGEKQPAPEKYMSNIQSNRQLFKKAYLIEFWGTDKSEPEDIFTFAIPPESEELTYTQRKTETKTFGGIHVDDYGIDAVKIILSGSTVNQSLRRIYQGYKSEKWLSGEEEIYYLRDLMMKHRTINNLIGKEKQNKKIVIYDLSKTTHRNGVGSETPIKNYWNAYPGEFKIRRSNDRPFTYKYSFEFTGVALKEGVDFISHGKPPEINDAELGLLQSIMEKLIGLLRFIDKINAFVNDVLDKINQVAAILKILGNVMSYAANTITGIIDSVGDAIVGLIDGVKNIVNGVNDLLSIPRQIQLKALNVGLELQNATKDLVKSVDSLSKNCRDMFRAEYWEIPKEVLDQYGMSNEEFKDSVIMLFNQAENTANEMAAAAKSANIPEVTIGNPYPETGAQRIILSYGDMPVMIKETDTLDSLAGKYLGDPEKAIDIAAYNGVAALSDLNPGDTIKIPITTLTQRMKRNFIFARRGDRDNYGRDILLSDNGSFMVSTSGDYALTNGINNISQAILMRLKESVSKRIRLNAYGIRTNISDQTAGIAYIISSIELTVSSDPRVESVDNIRFSSGGDYLNVNVDYSDINKSSGNISGRV